jgi:hypothetical protein
MPELALHAFIDLDLSMHGSLLPFTTFICWEVTEGTACFSLFSSLVVLII